MRLYKSGAFVECIHETRELFRWLYDAVDEHRLVELYRRRYNARFVQRTEADDAEPLSDPLNGGDDKDGGGGIKDELQIPVITYRKLYGLCEEGHLLIASSMLRLNQPCDALVSARYALMTRYRILSEITDNPVPEFIELIEQGYAPGAPLPFAHENAFKLAAICYMLLGNAYMANKAARAFQRISNRYDDAGIQTVLKECMENDGGAAELDDDMIDI